MPNCGHATAADIESLIAQIKKSIAQKTGFNLVPEVVIIGESILNT